MLYREIIAVCSQIHTKHINTLCEQNVEPLNDKLAVRIVTTGTYKVSKRRLFHLNHFSTAVLVCNSRSGTVLALQ
jgi:hypothetical protein